MEQPVEAGKESDHSTDLTSLTAETAIPEIQV